MKETGPNQALTDSTIESLKDPCNHHCGIDHEIRSINVAVKSFLRKACLAILQPRFEENRERELQASHFKNNQLEHKCLECWMCLFVECVTDQDKQHHRAEANSKISNPPLYVLELLTRL